MKALDFGCLGSTTTRGTPLGHNMSGAALLPLQPPGAPPQHDANSARLVPTPVYEPQRPRTIGAHHAFRGDSAKTGRKHTVERQLAANAAVKVEKEELEHMRGEIQRLREQLGVNDQGAAQVLILDDSRHNGTPSGSRMGTPRARGTARGLDSGMPRTGAMQSSRTPRGSSQGVATALRHGFQSASILPFYSKVR